MQKFSIIVIFRNLFDLILGICLYLVKGVSKVNGYSCHNFRNGCPSAHFLSDRIFECKCCYLNVLLTLKIAQNIFKIIFKLQNNIQVNIHTQFLLLL